MDINKNLNTVDKALTKFGEILKKHWGKLTILAILTVAIWFCLLVKRVVEDDDTFGPQPTDEQYQQPIDTTNSEYYNDSTQ